MTRPLFGSYGPRQTPFERRGQAKSKPGHKPVFGKRQTPPALTVSLRHERLRGLCAELTVVLSDPAYPDQSVPVRLCDEGLTIKVGDFATIAIDGKTGAFVLTHSDGSKPDVFLISDVDRLMDLVIAQLIRHEDAPAPVSGLVLIEKNVGRTIKQVEQALILTTLRRCAGNRTQAARVLGISLRTLRNKLREYWSAVEFDDQSSSAGSSSSHRPQSVGQQQIDQGTADQRDEPAHPITIEYPRFRGKIKCTTMKPA